MVDKVEVGVPFFTLGCLVGVKVKCAMPCIEHRRTVVGISEEEIIALGEGGKRAKVTHHRGMGPAQDGVNVFRGFTGGQELRNVF